MKLEAGDYSATVSPELGSNVLKITYRGRDLLWCPEEEAARRARPQLAGAAVLFPADRVRKGTFRFEGRDYRFPLNLGGIHHAHGCAKDAAWTVVDTGRKGGQAFCATSLDSRCCPGYDRFPHLFQLGLETWVTDHGVRLRWSVANLSTRNMPWTLGVHLNLAADRSHQVELQMPLKEGWKLDSEGFLDPSLETSPHPTNLCLDGPVKVHGPLVVRGDRVMTLRDKTAGHVVAAVLEGDWSHGTVWNGNGQDGFVSVEPLTGPIDAGNLGCPRILAPYTVWKGGVFVTAGDKENQP